jgi:hypothetical protein
MEELRLKIKQMILKLKSSRRERRNKLNNWYLTSRSILSDVCNIFNETSLVKDGRMICFSFLHKPDCPAPHMCTCYVDESQIQVYFLSKQFMKMINSSHSQIYFGGVFHPEIVEDLENYLTASPTQIELYTIGEASADEIDGSDENGFADNIEFENEETPEYNINKDEFDSLLCEYLKIAFTNPASLPRFLLSDIGPKMPLSELNAWLESE